MKNNKLFLKIYISLLVIIVLVFISFSILGNKTRVGYLGEFKFGEVNIYKTLELNGISYIKENYIIDGKLDEESIKQFIFTNETITNYSYGFRLKYYSKVFRNSDIYSVYINTNQIIQDNDFIKEIKMDENGSPFGNLISSKIIDFEKIDNIDYTLKIKSNIIYAILFTLLLALFIWQYKNIINSLIKNKNNLIIIIVLIVLIINTIILTWYLNLFVALFLIVYFYIKYYLQYKLSLSKEDNLFIYKIEVIAIVLFLFNFFLCFPGHFLNGDNVSIMYQALKGTYDNWHPAIIPMFLHIMYETLGIHTYYIFLLNLILWYSALFILVFSLYMKFKKKKVILLFLLSFLSDIFFYNMNQVKDSTATLFVFFAYSLLFALILLPIKDKKVYTLTLVIIFISLIISMLWRHNFIVTIYPIFITLSCLFLDKKGLSIKKYITYFSSLMIIFALILIIINKSFPILSNIEKVNYSITDFMMLFDIMACSAPANDDSLIPDDWYMPGKTFKDAKETYNRTPLIGDYLSASWLPDTPFIFEKKHNINNVWIKYILKYPINYIKHKIRIAKEFIIIKENEYKLDVNTVQSETSHLLSSPIKDPFYIKKINFNTIQYNIYNFFYQYLLKISILFFLILSFILFIITSLLLMHEKNKNLMLLFSFSTSLSSIVTFIIISLFVTIAIHRYIYPIIPISIISLLGLIAFIYEKGGIKKLISCLENKG